MGTAPQQPVNASVIRAYLRTHYFEPARQRRETLVTLRAGDIHRELGLRNRVPSVCQVMESKRLEREAGVRVSSKQGPPSGIGTALTVTYSVDSAAPLSGSTSTPHLSNRLSPDHPCVALFYALRGACAGVWDQEGGGEAWLRKERDNDYSLEKEKWL